MATGLTLKEMPRPPLGETVLLVGGVVVALVILGTLGWHSYRNLAATVQAESWVSHTYVVDEQLEHLFSTLQDMEASERGYLIMGQEDYLRPYNTAKQTVAVQLASLERLTADNSDQSRRLKGIEALVYAKLAELKEVIEVRRSQGFEAAHSLMAAGKGQALSEEIRKRMTDAEVEEMQLLHGRIIARDSGLRRTRLGLLAGGALSLILLTTVFLFLLQENHRRRRAEGELRRRRDDLQKTVAARTADLSQANETLRKSEERERFALETSHTGAWELDLGDHSAHRSPEHDRIFGYSELLPQWTYEMFLEHVLPEDRLLVDDKFRRAVETGGDWNFECRIRRTDQQVRWIWAAGRHRTDAAGVRRGMTGIVQDITERKRGEEALRESERQFRTLADSIPNLAWWANSDGYITWYNRRWYDYTGTTPRAMEGWGWQSVHDPEALPAVLERWKASIATGQPFDMTFPLRGADGIFRPFLTRVMPLKDARGRVQQWFGTNTDVSEQKRAEEADAQLAAIVESSDDAILSNDLGGIITSWNTGAERMFGYRPDEVVGRSILLLLPADRQDEEAQIMARLQAGERVDHFDTVRLAKDGRSLVVSITISLLKDGEGRIIGASKIIRDNTERRQVEEAVHRLNAELQQRVADLQRANEEVQSSRRAALSLAEDALEARQAAERVNDDLQKAFDSLALSRRAALNLMDDAVRARKQAEQATAGFRNAAEQRRLALEAADLGAWDYQFQTGEVFWDERCREMWGIPQAEKIDYDGAIAAIHPEDRAAVDEAVKQALAGKSGGAYHREFRVVWPDGSTHWIASHGRVYFQGEGDPGHPIRFIGANQDITERKQREEQLQKLNRTLKAHSKSDQALMRATREADYLESVCRIVVEDCGHAMVWVGFAENDEGRRVRPAAQAGFEEGYLETLDVTWADTERGRGPTGTAIRSGQPSMCRNMLTDPAFAPWRAEAVKRGYASSLVLPLLAEGRAFGALTIYSEKPDGFIEDEVRLLTELASDVAHGITSFRLRAAKAQAEEAQRQSEERYRGLVELSPEALFVNRNDRIVLVNPAALRLFGASSADQLLGKPPLDVFHRDCHAIVRERISRILAGQRVPVVEEKVVRLDGVVLDVEVVAAPVMDQGERAIQVLLRDITQRKRAQVALQQATEELKRSNRDLEQFAYVASHDLQEPLRAVGGYVKLLQHRFPDKLDAKAQGYIAGAFDGATRMERLITDLLAFSRVGTRGGEFAPNALDEVLGRALRNLQASIESTHATVTYDPLPTLAVDATQMMQLFQNLIGNGLKFHGESPLRIHVGAQRREGHWVFSVRDNGIGIEPQYYERIFQIFKRLHTRTEYPGTGIGLAICKKIVERHGGTIWVESQPGQGSTFCFSIPEEAAG